MNLSREQLSHLARINLSPEGQLLRQLLKDWLAEADKLNRVLTGTDLHQSQGRAQAFEMLLAELDGAKAKLDTALSRRIAA